MLRLTPDRPGISLASRSCSTTQFHGVSRLRRQPRCSVPSVLRSRTVASATSSRPASASSAAAITPGPSTASGLSSSRVGWVVRATPRLQPRANPTLPCPVITTRRVSAAARRPTSARRSGGLPLSTRTTSRTASWRKTDARHSSRTGPVRYDTSTTLQSAAQRPVGAMSPVETCAARGFTVPSNRTGLRRREAAVTGVRTLPWPAARWRLQHRHGSVKSAPYATD